jgi:hypothetical protein
MGSTKAALAAVVLWCSVTSAQQYVISSYAGGAPPVPVPAQGTGVAIGAPQ